jgi:hypothetical protein
MLDAAAIRTEAKQSGTWDINAPLERRIAKVPGDGSKIKFSDFYGKSNQRMATFGGGAAAGVCGNPRTLVGYISDYIPDYAAGETFRIVYGFYGSWANYYNEGYPCFQMSFTVGRADSYLVVGNANGGNKRQYMTLSYDGGNSFTLESHYGGGSTSWACNCTVYIFDFLYPDPDGLGSGWQAIGNFNDYITSHPGTTSFINHSPADTSTSTDTGPGTGNSCFLPGSLVRMADGSDKLIQDVVIGDLVLGAFGEINSVLALNRPVLGPRPMFKINSEHTTTDDHGHILPDRRIGALNLANALEEYSEAGRSRIQHVIAQDDNKESWLVPGIADTDLDLMIQMGPGDQLLKISGPAVIEQVDQVDLPYDTVLYNLVVGGSHTYYVDGYCVAGWLNGRDFDYRTWTAKGVAWTAEDYRQSDNR